VFDAFFRAVFKDRLLDKNESIGADEAKDRLNAISREEKASCDAEAKQRRSVRKGEKLSM
jgi:hypothetical protein